MNKPQLIEAAKTGDINRLQALIENGEALEQKDDYGWTALNWAAGRRGDTEIVKLLLEAGANPINSGRDLRTPYQIALAAARVETATLLQQAEQESGIASKKPARPFCKAYPVNAFHEFPDWRIEQSLSDDAVVYLHQDFSVTESMWPGENVVFDSGSEDWRNYCRNRLGFHVPTDLELAADYESRR